MFNHKFSVNLRNENCLLSEFWVPKDCILLSHFLMVCRDYGIPSFLKSRLALKNGTFHFCAIKDLFDKACVYLLQFFAF